MTTLYQNIEKYYAVICVVLFFMFYLIFYPKNILIIDEHAYLNQALAFSKGSWNFWITDELSGERIKMNTVRYNLGTGAYYAFFIFILGKKGVFVGSTIAIIASFWILHVHLRSANRVPLYMGYFFCCIPLLFYSRTIMSGIPSMLLISLSIYFFLKEEKTKWHWLLIGVLTSAVFWFRETNALLIFPLLLWAFYKSRPHLLILVGLAMGMMLESIANYGVYGSWWFMSASAGFSFLGFPQRALLYILITLFLIPGVWFWIGGYRGKGDRTILGSSIVFVFCYMLYSYTAVEYSGWARGSLLTSRFMLPIVPLAMVAFAEIMKRRQKPGVWERVIAFGSWIMMGASMWGFSFLLNDHEQVAKEMNAYLEDYIIIYDQEGWTNTIRYINPLQWDGQRVTSIESLSKGIKDNIQDVRIILSENSGNEEKIDRSNRIAQKVNPFLGDRDTVFQVNEGLRFSVYKLNKEIEF